MTYDLHGQWDYGSAFSQDGCTTGNCLRSHVNITETVNAFSMVRNSFRLLFLWDWVSWYDQTLMLPMANRSPKPESQQTNL